MSAQALEVVRMQEERIEKMQRRRAIEDRIKTLVAKQGKIVVEMRELKRVKREIQKMLFEPRSFLDGHLCRPEDGNLLQYKALVYGAKGTPYDGGTFVLNVRLPKEYPFSAPIVRFETKVWHPNVCPNTGTICQDLEMKDSSPAMTIGYWIVTMAARLYMTFSYEDDVENPRPTFVDSAQESHEWHEKARLWTQLYASPYCGCESCYQPRMQAFSMGMHVRLGANSAVSRLRGTEELLELIASFVRTRGMICEASFMRGWI